MPVQDLEAVDEHIRNEMKSTLSVDVDNQALSRTPSMKSSNASGEWKEGAAGGGRTSSENKSL